MSALGRRIGVTLATGQAIGERSQVVFASGITSTALAEKLSSQSDVEYAEVDSLRHALAVPNDPLYAASVSISPQAGQWYLRPPAGAVLSSVNSEGAWHLVGGNTNKVVVAMLATGVRFDHPDLLTVAQGGALLPGYDMVSKTVMAGDGQAVNSAVSDRDADPSDPGDFLTAAQMQSSSVFSGCSVQTTSTWHGTETSGLVAALTGNGIGMASMSGPGRNLQVLPVRVLGKCGGYDSDIQAGIRWAAGLSVDGVPANTTPAKVINMSLGGTGSCSQSYVDAVAAANAVGVVGVAAAGNSEGLTVGTPAN
jgi:serine protease